MAATTMATTNKIGFLTRTFAYLIDGIGLYIIQTVLTSILFGGDGFRGSGLNLLLGLGYFLYFWSSYGHGQTIGMKLFGIRVVKTDGSELTITNALIRYLGLLISFFCFAIGVIWVAFDPNKQGWHDKIAGTYVVRT